MKCKRKNAQQQIHWLSVTLTLGKRRKLLNYTVVNKFWSIERRNSNLQNPTVGNITVNKLLFFSRMSVVNIKILYGMALLKDWCKQLFIITYWLWKHVRRLCWPDCCIIPSSQRCAAYLAQGWFDLQKLSLIFAPGTYISVNIDLEKV